MGVCLQVLLIPNHQIQTYFIFNEVFSLLCGLYLLIYGFSITYNIAVFFLIFEMMGGHVGMWNVSPSHLQQPSVFALQLYSQSEEFCDRCFQSSWWNNSEGNENDRRGSAENPRSCKTYRPTNVRSSYGILANQPDTIRSRKVQLWRMFQSRLTVPSGRTSVKRSRSATGWRRTSGGGWKSGRSYHPAHPSSAALTASEMEFINFWSNLL